MQSLIRGATIFFCCLILLIPLTGAESVDFGENGSYDDTQYQIFPTSDSGSLNLDELLSGDVISALIALLISFFLSILGVSSS